MGVPQFTPRRVTQKQNSMKKYKNKLTGAIALESDFGGATPDANWELVQDSLQFTSTARRGCTLLEKLSGTWQILAVNPSNGGERGTNPILTITQNGITKRSYTHPSNIPDVIEQGEKFLWGIPKITDASTVTVKDGEAVFNW